MKAHCSQALNELLGVWSSSCWMDTWASAWKWKLSLSIIIRASVSVSISRRPQGSSRILSGHEQWPGTSRCPCPPPPHNVPRIYTRYLHFFCNSKSKSKRGFSEHYTCSMQYTCTTDWDTRISCQYQLVALDISIYYISRVVLYKNIYCRLFISPDGRGDACGVRADDPLLPRHHQLHLRDVQPGVLDPHLLPVPLPLPAVQRCVDIAVDKLRKHVSVPPLCFPCHVIGVQTLSMTF